jgi:hypothetical protein
MLQRFPIPGANYGFALPDRSHGAVMEAGFIDTSDGRVEWPGEGLLRLDGVRFNGQLVMAGEGHESGHAWLRINGKWKEMGPTHGVECCAFSDTALYIAISGDTYKRVDLATLTETTHPLALGSQGIRYVDGETPIAGDATIGFNPAEFTVRGDVTAGQGHEGGALVNGRVIEPGFAFFIKLKRTGNALALFMVVFGGSPSLAFFFDRADVDTLPLPAPATPPPVVIVTPPPAPPVKETSVATASEPNRVELVRSIMQQHPEVNTKVDGERGQITDFVVLALGGFPYGRKDRDKDPENNNNSDDALTKELDGGHFEIYDIINGDGTPSWDFKGVFAEGENGFFRLVHAPSPATPGTPTAPPAGGALPASPGASLDAAIAALRVQLGSLAAEVASLKNAKPAEAKAFSLDGVRIALKTDNGHFLTAGGGGGGSVTAERPEAGKPVEGYEPGGWETFTVVPQ